MVRTVNEQPDSSAGSQHLDHVGRIADLMRRATRDVGEAEGVVLVLNEQGIPNITGWFHADVSPGFSATLPHIILDSLIPVEPESMREGSSAPRTTWSHVKIGSRAGTVGELWLYRGRQPASAPTASGSWVGPSTAMSAVLNHIGSWNLETADRESLSSLHRFARSLNAVPGLNDVCHAVARGFQEALRATSVVVELIGDDFTLATVATCGPTPTQDGTSLSRPVDTEAGPRGALKPPGEWLFDLVALVDADGTAVGAVTCFWDDHETPVVSLPLIEMMADQAAIAIERARNSHRSNELYWSAASAMADAVDARDSFTRHHARRVARYSREIAEQLAIPAHEAGIIEVAGLLHDVGKIGVPDRVLQMTGDLEPEDWDLIRRHPDVGGSLVSTFPNLAAAAPIIRHHHERVDGTGYPAGLKGDEIPIGARIISVVEAFDTLVSGRPYQPPWSIERTLMTLESLGGTQFDAEIVRVFSHGIHTGAIHVEVPAPAQTGDLDLHRWIGAEARAFGLLQRIGNQVGEIIEIGRFLARLKQIIEAEFPDSVVDIFIRDREHDHLIAMPDGTRPHLVHNGVYVMKPDHGIVGWVAQHGITQNVPDITADPRYISSGDDKMHAELAVPMLLDDACIGVLNLESPRVGAYSRTDANVLETIASYVARAVQVAELHSQVKQQTDIDSMTGLLNHRAFYRTLEIEVDRATRAKDVLSVAIIDVDAFKLVNDSKGHVWGDAVIRRLAAILSSSVRHGDAVARYGGDEFALIMPGASREAIQRRMRAIEDEIRTQSEYSPLPQVSWGTASFPDDGLRPTDLVAQADAAMYAVKQRSSASA